MSLPDRPPAPGWVELGAVPNRGLDLTGLRLPVQVIGNELLDGITTITPSVRYVSFYSWILFSYLNARRPDSWRQFASFAEQVETAIAIGNILWDPQVLGLVGSEGASRLVGAHTDPSPLKLLVVQPAVDIYFNPAQQLRFVMRPTREVPGLTRERGEPLAKFIRSVFYNTRLGARFSAAELVPEATREDLREFGQAAHLPSLTDEEADLLVEGIIPPAATTPQEARRAGTYACVLGLADTFSRPPTEDDFFEEAQRVKRSLAPQLHAHLNGWLRYSVRDAIAVGHEYLLQEVIQALTFLASSRTSVASSDVVAYLMQDAAAHNVALESYGLLRPGENARDLGFGQLRARVDASTAQDRITEQGITRWSGDLTEMALIKAIRTSPSGTFVLLPVVWCLATCRTASWIDPEGNPFEGRRGIAWNAIGVHEVVAPAVEKFTAEGWRLEQVASELALRTIDQHLRVSWSRMAVDTRHDVALLIAEGDRWRSRSDQKHVRDFRAGRTASRLSQVVNWLQQLRLLDQTGLTHRGRSVYERCLRDLGGEVGHEAA